MLLPLCIETAKTMNNIYYFQFNRKTWITTSIEEITGFMVFMNGKLFKISKVRSDQYIPLQLKKKISRTEHNFREIGTGINLCLTCRVIRIRIIGTPKKFVHVYQNTGFILKGRVPKKCLPIKNHI